MLLMKSNRTTVAGLAFILVFFSLVITYNYVVNLSATVVEFTGYFFAVFVLPLLGCLAFSFMVNQTIAKTLNRTQKVIILLAPSSAVLCVNLGFFFLFRYIGMH
jgi:hypothetical protein